MTFSIVIPTRNRPEYLSAAVRSAMGQTDAENVEVLVFDNASTIHASEVLSSMNGSACLRIVRVERPLPMRDSWETALALARGEFVTILGDDDALLPNAVRVGRELIELYDVDIIRWDRAHYTWPCDIEQTTSNILRIPMGRTAYMVDGHKVLRDIGRGKATFAVAPLIYCSWVKMELINSIKKKYSRFFHSAMPDVDSGFVLAYCCKIYLSLNFPLGVCGVSPKSNGAQQSASYRVNLDNISSLDAVSDYNRLNVEARITKAVNHVEPMEELMVQTYRKIVNILKIPKNIFRLDERQVIKRIIDKELPYMDIQKKRLYLEQISSDAHTLKFTLLEKQAVAKSLEIKKVPENIPPQWGFDPFEQILTIECRLLGIADSANVALIVDKLIGVSYITKNILRDSQPKNWIKKVRSLAYRIMKMKDTDFSFSKFRNRAV